MSITSSGDDDSVKALAERLAGNAALPLPAASPFVTPAFAALGIAVVAAVGWILVAPHRRRTQSPAEHRAEREQARAIVARHGADTLAYFALRDDKDWFFTGHSVVAYAVRNGVCLVSPDPIGPPEERADAWADFCAFADANGWSVAVMAAGASWLPIYQAMGMRAIYLGDEAIVDCTAFTLDGGIDEEPSGRPQPRLEGRVHGGVRRPEPPRQPGAPRSARAAARDPAGRDGARLLDDPLARLRPR